MAGGWKRPVPAQRAAVLVMQSACSMIAFAVDDVMQAERLTQGVRRARARELAVQLREIQGVAGRLGFAISADAHTATAERLVGLVEGRDE